jgi:hypothetical protein
MTSPTPLPPRRAWPIVLAVFGYLACWALLRPPLQSPDEPQHLLKAVSVREQPWFNAVGNRFVLDRARVNPLAVDTPPELGKLFFQSINALSIRDIDAARQTPWLAVEGAPIAPYQVAIATYPQVYYWSVFLLAEPVVRGFGLDPWDATYVYRLVTCALVALLWGLVWRATQRLDLPSELASALVVLPLATPMLAFISSAVNPDAVNNALCTLAIVTAWRVLAAGDDAPAFAASLFAAAMTKPSGLQLAAVLAAVAVGLALCGLVDRRRAAIVVGVAAGTIVLAFGVFYAWQPPRFLAGGPSADGLGAYLAERWASIPHMWQMYWGRLGWLDYHGPFGWYWLVLALALANLACLAWRPSPPPRLAAYFGAVWIVFFGSTLAAEFRYLAEAGYTFQGRYLLPAGMAFGVVLLHRVRAARVALLAGVVLLNLALMRETVRRYYGDGWRGVVHALPFRG